MNGSKLPETIKELSKEKEVTLFVDGDRGGNLIIKNVIEVARIKFITMAPEGKEVEELTGKEILANLRKKVPAEDFFSKSSFKKPKEKAEDNPLQKPIEKFELSEENKNKLKEISKNNQGSGKAILLDDKLEKLKVVSTRSLNNTLRRVEIKPSIIVIDGTVTNYIIQIAEEINCKVIVAKNFATTDTKIQLLSL